MDKHEQEKLEDAKSILKIRTDNAADIADYPAVDEDIDDIGTIVAAIDLRSPSQKSDNTGITKDKKSAKIILAEEIFKHAVLAGSYFMKKGDMTNFNKVNYKFWKLKRLKPTDLKIAAVNMVKICTEKLTVLLPYKITAVTVARITTANASYEPLSNEPKEKRIVHTINTKAINDKFTELDKIVNVRLRGSLMAMKDSLPDLYYLLYNLTFDDKLGAHSHYPPSVVTGNLIVKVINSATGEPIEGVSLKAVGFPQVRLTDNFGVALLVLPVGSQKIKLIYFDFQETEFTIEIIDGEQNHEIMMTLAL